MYRSILTLVFFVIATAAANAEAGLASYYHGRGARGEMTCAHRTRPMGSMVTVSHAGRSIRCRVIDVSISAARALGMIGSGIINVSLE
jgi:rare lipoprotein A